MKHATRLMAIFVAQLLLGFVCCQAIASEAGKTVMVRNEVKGTPAGGDSRQMTVGDPVALGLELATGKFSAFRMNFDPKGDLVLGADTKLTVEQSLVDKATGRTTSRFALGVGWMRLEVGKLFDNALEINTPSAVIGIKGTIVHIFVDAFGMTTVVFEEGSGSVQSLATGLLVLVPAGSFVTVPPGGSPSAPAPVTPSIQAMIDQAMADAGLASNRKFGVVVGLAAAAAVAAIVITNDDDDHSRRETVSP